jgi:hypothetical protein
LTYHRVICRSQAAMPSAACSLFITDTNMNSTAYYHNNSLSNALSPYNQQQYSILRVVYVLANSLHQILRMPAKLAKNEAGFLLNGFVEKLMFSLFEPDYLGCLDLGHGGFPHRYRTVKQECRASDLASWRKFDSVPCRRSTTPSQSEDDLLCRGG